MAQAVECLLSKLKVPSSNPSTARNKKKKNSVIYLEPENSDPILFWRLTVSVSSENYHLSCRARLERKTTFKH
jgi:hypothetical protein